MESLVAVDSENAFLNVHDILDFCWSSQSRELGWGIGGVGWSVAKIVPHP